MSLFFFTHSSASQLFWFQNAHIKICFDWSNVTETCDVNKYIFNLKLIKAKSDLFVKMKLIEPWAPSC